MAPTVYSKGTPFFFHLQVETGGFARIVIFSLKESPSVTAIVIGPSTTALGAS